ncbi:unnamed protein product [Urochloa decumbens]|uniref:Importin subunit alpha n=1 Tax=Urochloa decumbens TaxID=240449 RepID=A0ABC8YWZ2_9POAL
MTSERAAERSRFRSSRFKYVVDADDVRPRRRREEVYIDLIKRRPTRVLPQSVLQGLGSDDTALQLEAMREVKTVLSVAEQEVPSIKKVVRSGVVPFIVQLLDRESCPQLQFEAAWALSKIISSGTSDNADMVVDLGAVPILVKLLSSPTTEDVREQAVQGLGSMALKSAACRDKVLEHGAVAPLLQLLNANPRLSLLKAISNLCRGSPAPNFGHVKPTIPVLRQLIYSQDVEIISEACWALSYLSDCTDDKITPVIIDNESFPRLTEFLNKYHSPSLLIPVLRVIGNIAASSSVQTQAVIDGNMIGPMVRLMQTASFNVRKEAVQAISKVTSSGTHDQIKYLVSEGCIKAFCDLLGYTDFSSILMLCLEGLGNILKAGVAEKSSGACTDNMYALMIEDADMQKIEDLQDHRDFSVYEMAINLIESYFEVEEIYEDVTSKEDAPQTPL